MSDIERARALSPLIHSTYDDYVVLPYAPAPDVRYVGLTPAPSFTTMSIAAATVSLSGAGLAIGPDALWAINSSAFAASITAVAAATCALAVVRQRWRLRAPIEARQVHMAIVPWGIIVEPAGEPRILRWSAVRKIDVQVKHSVDGGTPSIVSSVVTVRTDREALSGYAHGAVGLETLMANVDAYAHEASCLVSLDLAGNEPVGDGELLAVVPVLVRQAWDLCSTGWGAAELGLPPGGYRAPSIRTTGPETVQLLHRALGGSDPTDADPRPIASLVAAFLGASELIPDLVRLANRPHPLVAAVARASALRLGAPPSKAGSLDELADFLSDEDLRHLERFAAGSSPLLT